MTNQALNYSPAFPDFDSSPDRKRILHLVREDTVVSAVVAPKQQLRLVLECLLLAFAVLVIVAVAIATLGNSQHSSGVASSHGQAVQTVAQTGSLPAYGLVVPAANSTGLSAADLAAQFPPIKSVATPDNTQADGAISADSVVIPAP